MGRRVDIGPPRLADHRRRPCVDGLARASKERVDVAIVQDQQPGRPLPNVTIGREARTGPIAARATEDPGTHFFTVEHLNAYYGDFLAVRDASMTFNPRE